MEVIALLALLMVINIHYPRIERPSRIKRRDGGTPIIDATFNRDEKFEMMVDTGASITQISQKMAKALNVKTEGKRKAILADGREVEFPYGYVDSVEAGGIKADNVIVFIGGSEKDPGLLGQNFYGDYKVVIDRDSIEFKR